MNFFKNVTAPVDEGITDVMKRDSDVDKIEVVQVISDFNKGGTIYNKWIFPPFFMCKNRKIVTMKINYWREKNDESIFFDNSHIFMLHNIYLSFIFCYFPSFLLKHTLTFNFTFEITLLLQL